MKNVYILGACRTPIGSFCGTLSGLSSVDLGSIVIKESLKRANIDPASVDEVVMGNVLQAGAKQSPARQMAVRSGIPVEVPATTINKLCGSSLHAVTLAYRYILCGEADCVVAGGAESMTNAPFVLNGYRTGVKMGEQKLVDSMLSDGLFDAFNDYHMGITAENVAEQYNVTREMQDEFAVSSQKKAAAAIDRGAFKDQIVTVTVPKKKGDPIIFDTDEYVRGGTTLEKISSLKPAFKKDGTVTAANASGINDGAACVVVVSEDFLKAHNLKPQARIIATGSKGVDPSVMGLGPIPSVRDALGKCGLKIEDMKYVEANEAFAAQAIEVGRELRIKDEQLNPNGGAIALGHPIGASGCRILVTLIHALKAGEKGIATLCIGGGMGEACIIEKM